MKLIGVPDIDNPEEAFDIKHNNYGFARTMFIESEKYVEGSVP